MNTDQHNNWTQYALTFVGAMFVHFLALIVRGQAFTRKTALLVLSRAALTGAAAAGVWSFIRAVWPKVPDETAVGVAVGVALLGVDYLVGLLAAKLEQTAGVKPNPATPAPEGGGSNDAA